MENSARKTKGLMLWLGFPILIALSLYGLKHFAPRWTDLSYDPYDGRVILQSFENKFATTFNPKVDPKGINFIQIPKAISPSNREDNRPVFSLIYFHFHEKIENGLQRRLKPTKAELEVKAVYLTRGIRGEYQGNTWNGMSLQRDSPASFGVGASDVRQDANLNGAILASQVGPLKRNSHLKLNEDFYFVQSYDQFRVYRVDDLPWTIRNGMKGRIEKIFEAQAGVDEPRELFYPFPKE